MMFGTMQEILIRDTVNKSPAALGYKRKRQVLKKNRVTIYVKSIQNKKKIVGVNNGRGLS